MIGELRILPPLAVGRLGASPTPVDNYRAEHDPDRPLGYRRLVPAETLRVDVASGEIVERFVPGQLTFKDGAAVRPVAPFLELWALTADDVLEPVTLDLLEQEGLAPAAVRWRVHVANHKLLRRTADRDDRIEADTGDFSDHAAQPLAGRCANFVAGASLPLGHVQYIKPTAAFPEIRLRFTPAGGFVYASTTAAPDPLIPAGRVLYDSARGRWRGYSDQANPDPSSLTVPANIYAGMTGSGGVSKGYFDDECDGLVHASLTVGGRTLTAYARIGAGPPAYAPDSFPVRTVHDELEQALLGPQADAASVSLERVEEMVRRAFETIRLMHAAVMNANAVPGVQTEGRGNNMASQDSGDTGRAREPIMATSLVDTKALERLHQSLLVALRSGTAPWFADVLRDFDEIGDLSDKGRRKMPALMRNADGRGLTLTRRQVDIVRRLAGGPIYPEEGT